MNQRRVAVDAMGGDHAPAAVIEGSVAAARELGIAVTLVGDEAVIRRELGRHGAAPPALKIEHAPAAVAMDEHATAGLRHRRDTSLAVGVGLVKDGRAGAFVSAGNSGATMAVATMLLGRQPGIERPALGTVFPSERGRFLLLDVGANADARPSYLVQFAELGRGYAERVLRVGRPRVGLLNIGEEPGKGSEFAREVHERLAACPGLNFIGNIEGKDLTRGLADVVVTDGFTGNVAIKTAEGVAEFIMRELRGALTSRLRYKLAALALRPALLALRGRIDYAEYGGAPLLGLNGAVLISHGRSNARAIRSAVRAAQEAAALDWPAPAQASSRAAGSGEAS
ncbi:MAG TPA: phosphate acyltransferase PlsX [Dehalococcoidia bacterium]|nr:phosphate acyltransferase PlsX [Dehalococcoidia bacterium]